MSYRIGFGIDFHQLAAGRDLWIGGGKIPHEKGSLGHSDADVLLHAICDAMLGALALGDIGIHFPNTDPAYKDKLAALLPNAKTILEVGCAVFVVVVGYLLQRRAKAKKHADHRRQLTGDLDHEVVFHCGLRLREIGIGEYFVGGRCID